MKGLAAWIETWPWTKSLTAAGVIGFTLVLGVGGWTLFAIVIFTPLRDAVSDNLELFKETRLYFNDALQWSMLAATGGVIGLVGKRMSTKPEVVAAEADASVKVIEATAAAVPPLTGKQAVEAARAPLADQEVATAKPMIEYTIKPGEPHNEVR
jgi:hypothetical protein